MDIPVFEERPSGLLAPANRFIACASPFSDRRVDHELPHGLTIAEMLDVVDLKPAYRQFAHVWLCDPEFKKDPVFVESKDWHRVRPRPGVVVTLRVAPGKGGGGGKSTIGIVLQIAVLAISAAATFFLGPVLGLVVGFALKLAMNALIPPPKQKSQTPNLTGSTSSPQQFSITGTQNQAAPYAPIPRIYGRHRVWPYYAAKPYTEIEGSDQYLRVLFCLGFGPLEIDEDSFKIGETPLSQYTGVETDVRQGFDDDAPITLYSNLPRETQGLNIEIANDGIRTPAVAATGTLTFSGNAGNGQTVTIRSRVYTFKTSITTTAGDVLIGGTASDSIDNLIAAINRFSGAGTLYAAATTVNADVTAAAGAGDTMVVTAKTAGTAANAYATTETLASGSWGGSTLAGGAAEVSNDPMTEDEKWITQTTDADTDEISFDINFPQGLVWFHTDSSGDNFRQKLTVRFDIRYRDAGSSDPWIYVGTQSQAILTVSVQPTDSSTVTIDGKVYTFQTTLTNVDGHVARGANLAASLSNLAAAINLGAGSGTAYAAATTIHPTVSAVASSTTVTITAKHVGDATGIDGDTITVSETLASGAWDATKLYGGVDALSIRANETVVRTGKRFIPAARGQYDVQIRRLTENKVNPVRSGPDQYFDRSYLTALRSIQYGNPVRLTGLALVAIRIHATDQLNGVIDTFNCVVTAMLPTWDGAAWTDPVATRSPAWAYANEFRGNHIATPVSDDRIDLDVIKDWADDCDTLAQDGTPKYCCDGAFTDAARVRDRLRDIAAAGRASIGISDDKFSITRDIAQTAVLGHIGPMNSWGFRSTRVFTDQPHAIKVQFIDEDKGYQQNELIVYADGYSASNASLFESMSFPMVVRSRQIWSDTRYHQAVAILRPETYQVYQDIEHISIKRGDLVRASHDVPLWGISRGRIKAIILDVDGDCVGLTLSEIVTMEEGKAYNLRIRRDDGTSQAINLITDAGDSNTVAPAIALSGSDIPEAKNWFAFGETARESVELIVQKIEPTTDFSALITLVDASPAIHDADQGTIPAFDPGITDPVPLSHKKPPVPVITGIESDETVLAVQGDGSYIAAIAIDFGGLSGGDIPAAYVEAQYRRQDSETAWLRASVVAAGLGQVSVTPVDSGETYDIRVRSIGVAGQNSDWATISGYTVVGDTSLPPAPENPRQSGDEIIWDYPSPPPDFRGGGFRVKAIAGSTVNWTAGFLLSEGLITASRFDLAGLTNGAFIVMIKAVDRSGNESEDAVYIVVDRGTPNVFNAIDTTDYAAGGFPGVITNGTVGGSVLTADVEASAMWPSDLTAPMWSSDVTAAMWGASAAEMTYVFDFTVGAGDGGSTLRILTTVNDAPWTLEYSTDSGTTYLTWPGQIIAQEITYKFRLITAGGDLPGEVTALSVVLDIDDEEEFLQDIAISSSGTRLPITKAYRFIDNAGPAPRYHSGETAITLRVQDNGIIASNLVTDGPLVYAFDAAGSAVNGHGDFRIHGGKALT